MYLRKLNDHDTKKAGSIRGYDCNVARRYCEYDLVWMSIEIPRRLMDKP